MVLTSVATLLLACALLTKTLALLKMKSRSRPLENETNGTERSSPRAHLSGEMITTSPHLSLSGTSAISALRRLEFHEEEFFGCSGYQQRNEDQEERILIAFSYKLEMVPGEGPNGLTKAVEEIEQILTLRYTEELCSMVEYKDFYGKLYSPYPQDEVKSADCDGLSTEPCTGIVKGGITLKIRRNSTVSTGVLYCSTISTIEEVLQSVEVQGLDGIHRVKALQHGDECYKRIASVNDQETKSLLIAMVLLVLVALTATLVLAQRRYDDIRGKGRFFKMSDSFVVPENDDDDGTFAPSIDEETVPPRGQRPDVVFDDFCPISPEKLERSPKLSANNLLPLDVIPEAESYVCGHGRGDILSGETAVDFGDEMVEL